MTKKQQETIRRLRESGMSYNAIAERMDISPNTVKSVCRRNGIQDLSARAVCLNCHKPLSDNFGPRRRFCCNTCKHQWAYQNRMLDSGNAVRHVCPVCREVFFRYPSVKQKYCSTACYMLARYGDRT